MATAEPFDPLSEGRAGDPASHTTLHQRGRVLQQLREAQRRRESYSVHSRRVSSALLAQQQYQQSKRILSTRRLLLSSSQIPEAPTPSLPEPLASVPDPADAETLVRSAVLALWMNVRLAMGFRQWKEAARAPTDLTRFGSGVDLTIEARRILLAAEAERARALQEPLDDDVDPSVVLSPRVLETAGVRLTRDELDLLTVWAKEVHSKTFRGVDDAAIGDVMRRLRLRVYRDGEPLFYEGETGDTFYLIVQGTVGVFVGMPASIKATLSPTHRENQSTNLPWEQLGKRVFTYRTGDCFGETAMFSADALRTASAVAVGPCEVCELHRDVYKRTLSKYHQQFFEQAQKLNFLQRVPLFRELARHKLTALADVLEKKRFHYGETMDAVARSCFLILAGVVKLTETVPVPGQSHALTPAEAALSTKTKKKKPVNRMKIELQTAVSNEIVGLEALLDPPLAILSTKYTATATSAHVDVYVLKESDARALVGGQQSALGQKILRQCETEAALRERRRKQTQQTMHHQTLQDTDDLERAPTGYTESIPPNDSVDVAAALPESPRSPEPLRSVPGLRVVKEPPAISDGDAPYLPHLRPTHLFPSGLAMSPRDASVVLTDLSVVSSPKMLSTCVRKFLFEHSDTLAHDYVERLSHQFPTPRPQQPLLFAGSTCVATTTRAQREDQRVLAQQLGKMYDSKMHWDAAKQDFVVASAVATASPRTGFLSSTPRSKSGNDVIVVPPSRDTDRTDRSSARRKSAFHQELQATQHLARKLVENHLKRVGGPPKPPDETNGANGAFLHFFADT